MTRTISIKNYLRIGLFGGLFVFIIIYAVFQTKALNNGVSLDVLGIQDGEIFTEQFVSLHGNALHAKHLLINDREIAIDKENNFSEELVLSPGYNIITIEAEDRFSKNTKEVYSVFYRAPLENVALSEPADNL